MRKRRAKRQGKCVHCLQDPVELTWDHVLPVSWYPTTTPPNLEKWQIPSCWPCNQDYGRIESDLLVRFGMCIDPSKPAAAGIADKALRALSGRHGKDEKDSRARQNAGQRFIAELTPLEQVPDHSLLPGFKEPLSQRQLETGGVRIPRKALHRFAEKICRGIFYIEEKMFIDASYEIEAHVVKEGGGAEVDAILDQYGASYTRGPGLVVRRAKTNDDPMSSLFSIETWGQLKMYASIVRAS